MSPPPKIIQVRHLAKTFADTQAVKDVSFVVEAGESVGLLGPNGAGKTTTLLMLLGAIEPDGGTVELDGYALPRQRAKAMRSVGFAAGYLPMPSRLTVRESLEFFAHLYGIRKPAVAIAEVLDRLSIGHFLNANADTLSSGQRTLVGIAKAILNRPNLLILDEPTASLDPDVADRVRSAIQTLHSQDGVTLLITSHDMAEIHQLCARVLFLQSGSLVADATPAQLVERYEQSDLTGVFLHMSRGTGTAS